VIGRAQNDEIGVMLVPLPGHPHITAGIEHRPIPQRRQPHGEIDAAVRLARAQDRHGLGPRPAFIAGTQQVGRSFREAVESRAEADQEIAVGGAREAGEQGGLRALVDDEPGKDFHCVVVAQASCRW
jgi:hypothetical protein